MNYLERKRPKKERSKVQLRKMERPAMDMANGASLGKRKAEITLDEEGDILEIMPIGAGSEVGRSCILLKFKGKHIMVHVSINHHHHCPWVNRFHNPT